VAVARRDQRLAVFQTHGGKDLIPKRLRPMPVLRLLAEQWDVIFPNDPALAVIFAHRAVTFVAHQIIAGWQLAGQPRVAVRMRMVDL
jgi:hypothetical protein